MFEIISKYLHFFPVLEAEMDKCFNQLATKSAKKKTKTYILSDEGYEYELRAKYSFLSKLHKLVSSNDYAAVIELIHDHYLEHCIDGRYQDADPERVLFFFTLLHLRE